MELNGEANLRGVGEQIVIADLTDEAGLEIATSSGPTWSCSGGGEEPGYLLVAPAIGRRCAGAIKRSLTDTRLTYVPGTHLSSVDITGDGRQDLVAGSYGANPHLDGGAGMVHVLTSPIALDATLGDASGVIVGATSGAKVGLTWDLGDLDLDGAAELGVSRYGNDLVMEGETEVASPPRVIAIPLGDVHGEVVFEDYPALFEGGMVEVRPTDTTGDGVADLHVTQVATGIGFPSALWTLVGPLELDGGYTPADAQGTVAGATPLGLGGAGDLDGDGLADLAIGACLEPGQAGERVGFVGILPGAAVPAHHALADLPITLEGDAAFAQTGAAIVGPGDLDGDGADDLVVGAPGDGHEAQEFVGEVLVFLGPLQGRLRPDDAALRLTSGREGSLFGWSLATGDLDGDGRPDLAVGAPSDADNNEGAVYAWTAAQLFPGTTSP